MSGPTKAQSPPGRQTMARLGPLPVFIAPKGATFSVFGWHMSAATGSGRDESDDG